MRNFLANIKRLLSWNKPTSQFAGSKRRVFIEDTTARMTLCFDIENEHIVSVCFGDRLIRLSDLLRQDDNLMLLGTHRTAHLVKYGTLIEPCIT